MYQGIAIMLVLVLVVAWIYDSYKSTNKNFFGLLKSVA